MIAQVLEAQTLAQQEAQPIDERGSARRAQRLAELSISLRDKAHALMKLDLAGGNCFEQWRQLERTVTRVTWLWMWLEFGKPEYLNAYHASL